LVNAADHAVVGFALDLVFFEHAVDQQRDPLFERFGVDDEFAEGGFLLLEGGDDFLQQRALLGAVVGAFFQAVTIDGFGFALGGRLGQLGIILGGRVGGGGLLAVVGPGGMLIAHGGCCPWVGRWPIP